MPKFKPGDTCVYKGASQAGVLATGDLVEVEAYDHTTGKYRIKYPFSYANYSFTADEHDLALETLDLPRPASYSYISEEENDRRKELGLCLKCGLKKRMSWHGLLPCSVCEPR